MVLHVLPLWFWSALWSFCGFLQRELLCFCKNTHSSQRTTHQHPKFDHPKTAADRIKAKIQLILVKFVVPGEKPTSMAYCLDPCVRPSLDHTPMAWHTHLSSPSKGCNESCPGHAKNPALETSSLALAASLNAQRSNPAVRSQCLSFDLLKHQWLAWMKVGGSSSIRWCNWWRSTGSPRRFGSTSFCASCCKFHPPNNLVLSLWNIDAVPPNNALGFSWHSTNICGVCLVYATVICGNS